MHALEQAKLVMWWASPELRLTFSTEKVVKQLGHSFNYDAAGKLREHAL